MGGIKIVTEQGWFVARPSGTEAFFKIHAESFRNPSHVEAILEQAQALISSAIDPTLSLP